MELVISGEIAHQGMKPMRCSNYLVLETLVISTRADDLTKDELKRLLAQKKLTWEGSLFSNSNIVNTAPRNKPAPC